MFRKLSLLLLLLDSFARPPLLRLHSMCKHHCFLHRPATLGETALALPPKVLLLKHPLSKLTQPWSPRRHSCWKGPAHTTCLFAFPWVPIVKLRTQHDIHPHEHHAYLVFRDFGWIRNFSGRFSWIRNPFSSQYSTFQ